MRKLPHFHELHKKKQTGLEVPIVGLVTTNGLSLQSALSFHREDEGAFGGQANRLQLKMFPTLDSHTTGCIELTLLLTKNSLKVTFIPRIIFTIFYYACLPYIWGFLQDSAQTFHFRDL